jgi:hypothetical protein
MGNRLEFYDTKTQKITRIKWVIDGYDNYCFAENNRCYNRTTGFEVKRSLVGYSKGYYLASKFITLKKLRTLIKILKM